MCRQKSLMKSHWLTIIIHYHHYRVSLFLEKNRISLSAPFCQCRFRKQPEAALHGDTLPWCFQSNAYHSPTVTMGSPCGHRKSLCFPFGIYIYMYVCIYIYTHDYHIDHIVRFLFFFFKQMSISEYDHVVNIHQAIFGGYIHIYIYSHQISYDHI